MKQLKELDKQVKAMQKRLEDYGKYEGMILNENYWSLMHDIDTIKYNVNNGVDVKPQTITGLIKRVKNVKKTKVIDMFDIYVPQLDNPKSVREALNIKFSFDWKIEELPRIFKEKAQETIERIRNKYKRKPTKEFEPEPEPPDEEVTFSDAVMDRIIDECLYEGRHIWAELANLINDCIEDIGYDETAKWFEEYAHEYGTSGELPYEDAKQIYSLLFVWSLNPDIETNKMFTEMVELGRDFGVV